MTSRQFFDKLSNSSHSVKKIDKVSNSSQSVKIWTSCQNLGTVAKTLKSLYIENPITQEPSWEKCKDHRAKAYANIVRYRTIQVATLRMMETPPIGYEKFIPLMEKKFIELYPGYLKIIKNMMKSNLNGKKITSPIYGMNLVLKLDTLKNALERGAKTIAISVQKIL